MKEGLVKKKEQKTIFQDAVHKLHERNAKLKEEIEKEASKHPRIEPEFKTPMKVNVDLKTIHAINNTDIATAHQTKNYHQIRRDLGNAANGFNDEVDKLIKSLLGYDDFQSIKSRNITQFVDGLSKINPHIHNADWFLGAKLAKFSPTRTTSHRKDDVAREFQDWYHQNSTKLREYFN